jgi:hypothetical protein
LGGPLFTVYDRTSVGSEYTVILPFPVGYFEEKQKNSEDLTKKKAITQQTTVKLPP